MAARTVARDVGFARRKATRRSCMQRPFRRPFRHGVQAARVWR